MNIDNEHRVRPGDKICLDRLLPAPLFLCGLRGTRERPIVLTASKAIKLPRKDPAKYANRVAYLRQESGHYPVIGPEADEAALVLKDCQYVLLRGLKFKDCWPTAVYIDRSQNIGVVDCRFVRGTIAIGANGLETRDILVENCRHHQTDKEEMWHRIEWEEIHGSYETARRPVDCKKDKRHFDGDFFRAWDIGGSVTIRGNHIRDAFNAIHFFNSTDTLAPGVKSNTLRFNSGRRASNRVLIEDNLFERIRDNCIEPEDHAWNWVVRNNSFANCYAPYSFDLDRAGWIYIYNNHHWLTDPPGADLTSGGRRGCSGFKSGGDQRNEGGIYVFNNSWLFRHDERLFRKGAIGRLRHYNNAIKTLSNCCGRLFGKDWTASRDLDATPEAVLRAEKGHFTRRWDQLRIDMDGDWIWDGISVDAYRAVGYALGPGTRNRDPGFNRPNRDKRPILEPDPAMANAGVKWDLQLPGYEETQYAAEDNREELGKIYLETIDAGQQVGAGGSREFLDRIDRMMTFIPDPPFVYDRKKPTA